MFRPGGSLLTASPFRRVGISQRRDRSRTDRPRWRPRTRRACRAVVDLRGRPWRARRRGSARTLSRPALADGSGAARAWPTTGACLGIARTRPGCAGRALEPAGGGRGSGPRPEHGRPSKPRLAGSGGGVRGDGWTGQTVRRGAGRWQPWSRCTHPRARATGPIGLQRTPRAWIDGRSAHNAAACHS